MDNAPVQKIYFGCPGVGKSHTVRTKHLQNNGGSHASIQCVFHPEYSYGDFMGKLLPLTVGDKVTYRYYPGHFMKALALAYKNLKAPVFLIIDEINRGNTAQIFGPIFQLLDRDDEGWSCYEIKLSDMEKFALAQEIHGHEITGDGRKTAMAKAEGKLEEVKNKNDKLQELVNGFIRIPPNLSIIGTMNTSDESIYYMDSAFKRRWEWEYIPIRTTDEGMEHQVQIAKAVYRWGSFVEKLNAFIREHGQSIRNVEDKQIGYWFIRPENGSVITESQIRNKLMFFLWDSVFTRDKTPLERLCGKEAGPFVTFGDFAASVEAFVGGLQPDEARSEGQDDSGEDTHEASADAEMDKVEEFPI